ncbi:MAG: hypothetical protein COA42_07005 [Alteromonadaceae bacterium]|nr:MAG: hypothetical protein COA42_07005 [Alteromonadaceae bacterium]
MRIAPLLLLFVCCCFFSFSNAVFAQNLSSTNLNSKNVSDKPKLKFRALDDKTIMSIGTIRSIAQDRLGFMWFGGKEGLARYDGYNVKLYLHDDLDAHSISTNSINDLLIGQDGSLWVATYWGLNRYDATNDRFQVFLYDSGDQQSLSNNSTLHLLEGKDGSIWVTTAGGGLNRLNPETGQVTRYPHRAGDLNSLSSNILTALYEDDLGILWVGLRDGGVDRFDPQEGKVLERFRYDPNNPNSLSSDRVSDITADGYGRIWVSTYGEGLNRYDPSLTSDLAGKDNLTLGGFIHYGVSEAIEARLLVGNFVDIHNDLDGNIWAAAGDRGLSVIRPEDNSAHNYSFSELEIESNSIRSMYSDRSGGVWLGHSPAGVSRIDRYARAFRNYRHDPHEINSSLSHTDVLSVIEDEHENLWIGTSKGLNYLDRDTGKITHYFFEEHSSNSLSSNAVSSLALDDKEGLWIGTNWGGLNRMDLKTGEFKHYMPDPDKPNSLGNREVWAIHIDSSGQLWVGNNRGVINRYRPETDDFSRYTVETNKAHKGRILRFLEDKQGHMWLASDDGLYRSRRVISTKDEDPGFWLFDSMVDNLVMPSVPVLRALSEDSKGNLWFGTEGGGVNYWDRHYNAYELFQSKDGLANDSVSGILEDDQGSMWFSTGNGLSRLDLETKTFRNYSELHGLPGNKFYHPTYLKTSGGELVFGSSRGLSIFKPKDMHENKRIPTIVLTDFQIFNKPVAVVSDVNSKDYENAYLHKTITYTNKITLNHKQSVFSLQFAALNYDISSLNQYAYYLEGFEEQWNYVGARRTATYTNLDSGTYVFHVKGANNEGVWNDTGLSLIVEIQPPWWLTLWAKIGYICILAVLIWLVIYTQLQRKRAEDEHEVNLKLRDLDKLKDAFLANTSYELRTPLSGIIGLSESLISGENSDLPVKTRENLELIVNSSKRLAYLIDDILDFSKLREDSIKLNRSSVNMNTLTDTILHITRPLVGNKPLILVNKVPLNLPMVFADENRLQQVLYNLVDNAVKFTNKGSVNISASEKDGLLWVEVMDTGIGIEADKLHHVFEPFEQVDRPQEHRFSGTGLGLAVTKKLVELHGGEIEIDSELAVGTRVRFSLVPSDKVALMASESITAVANYADPPIPKAINTLIDGVAGLKQSSVDHSSLGKSALGQSSLDQSVLEGELELDTEFAFGGIERANILVVDDEPVNRQVLVNLLSLKSWNAIECVDGQQALDVLNESAADIDLVLLDVMMPGINGYDVCRVLRKNRSVTQLPVLFLTAKTLVGDMEAAFQAGGNDFLSKPFIKEELFSRIEVHLTLANMHRRIEKIVDQRTLKLKKSYQALQRAQGQLVQAEKMSGLGTLVAGIGHEINNPTTFTKVAAVNLENDLGKFHDFLNSLLSDGEDNSEIQEAFEKQFKRLRGHLGSMHDGTRRIAEIVNNLRTFSRAESGEMQPSRLSRGLNSTLDLVRGNFKVAVEFECDIQSDPELNCVVSEMNQVFMNLMVNACQAIIGGGATYKEGDDELKGKLSIVMATDKDELVIAFQDTGQGMSEQTIEHIFEPFFTTKGEGEGTGLGMSISYGIIERHKGRIAVSSEIGKGSVIEVRLPLK